MSSKAKILRGVVGGITINVINRVYSRIHLIVDGPNNSVNMKPFSVKVDNAVPSVFNTASHIASFHLPVINFPSQPRGTGGVDFKLGC